MCYANFYQSFQRINSYPPQPDIRSYIENLAAAPALSTLHHQAKEGGASRLKSAKGPCLLAETNLETGAAAPSG